jgi:hypothetical protein
VSLGKNTSCLGAVPRNLIINQVVIQKTVALAEKWIVTET